MHVKVTRLVAPSLALAAVLACKAEPKLKPFVLASRREGDPAWVADEARARLEAAGFQVVGRYAPYDGAVVLAATSAELRAAAAAQRFGGYAVAQRVTVTKVGDAIQVAFTNPVYMAAAYRLSADLAPVAAKLAAALGRIEEYGPKDGESAKDLRRWRYARSMPSFDDRWQLARYGSQAEAIAAVEAGLAAGAGATKKVYRVDVSPDETVFGVALGEGCGADANVTKAIDAKPVRSTGYLPYEVLVSKGEVQALQANFRILVDFPDLAAKGEHGLAQIACAPDAIESALRRAASRQAPSDLAK